MPQSTLTKLTQPFSKSSFFDDIYEQKWQYFDEKNEELTALFTSSNLEEYIFKARPWEAEDPWSEAGMLCAKYPNGGFKPDLTSVDEALEMYADGHTIVLPMAHTRWPALARFCGDLSKQFNARVGANIYTTPPNSKGFTAHYDMHDVFLLQTEGTKIWHVKSCEKVPLTLTDDRVRGEFYQIDLIDDTKNSTEIPLSAGQKLYMPRGTIHQGLACDSAPSVHITFHILPILWRDLVTAMLVESSLKSPCLKKTVPFEVLQDLTSKKSQSLVENKIARAINQFDKSSLMRFIYERKNALVPSNGFESINALKKISLDSHIHIKDGADIFIFNHESDPWVSFCGRRISMPTEYQTFLSFVVDHRNFLVRELPSDPSDKYKFLFVEWLIKSGFAVFSEYSHK